MEQKQNNDGQKLNENVPKKGVTKQDQHKKKNNNNNSIMDQGPMDQENIEDDELLRLASERVSCMTKSAEENLPF